jgi:serine/threonine-protein kinase
MANDVFGIVGTTVAGAFKVEAVVAEGGFAVVYRAHHSGFRAPVALKCLKIPQYFKPDEQEQFKRQFQSEAELLFKLSASTPTVVRPLHVDAVTAPDGTFMPFLALEWLDGENLDALFRRRRAERRPPFSLDELLTLLAPVARALDRAHHFSGPEGPISIVHRDMKPENLFVARVAGEEVVKILDFGVAKAETLAQQAAQKARGRDSNQSSFTPAYAAPEQWAPKRFGPTGPWTDVWGFALTMVELLAGRVIIDGDPSAMMRISIDPARRPTPQSEGVVVTDAVEAVFRQALAVDPSVRFAGVAEFWDALRAAADGARRLESMPARSMRPQRTHALEFGVASELHQAIPDLETERPPAFAVESARSSPPPSSRPRFIDASTDPQAMPASMPPSPGLPATVAPRRAEPASSGLFLGDVAPALSDRGASKARAPLISPHRPVGPTNRFAVGASGTADLVRPFVAPLAMLTSGVLITMLGGAYAGASGQVFTLGPVRLGWIAASLVIAGIALGVYRLVMGER